MEDEKVVDAPVRFFAIGYADYEGYWETFVFATSAEDAVDRYLRWIRDNDGGGAFSHKYKVDVLEAELNKFGVLVSTDIIIANREVEC